MRAFALVSSAFYAPLLGAVGGSLAASGVGALVGAALGVAWGFYAVERARRLDP